MLLRLYTVQTLCHSDVVKGKSEKDIAHARIFEGGCMPGSSSANCLRRNDALNHVE